MQVVPHLFKIILVLCTVFLWGLISDFTFLIIFIYLFVQTTSFISAHYSFLCGSSVFENVMAKGNDSNKIFSPCSTSQISPCLGRAATHCKRLMWSNMVFWIVGFCPVY